MKNNGGRVKGGKNSEREEQKERVKQEMLPSQEVIISIESRLKLER